jgi:hypothetical protein
VPDDDDHDSAEDDKFRPEAIAARIDKIGAETETDRIAHDEEQKLLQRRRERKRTGLEAAASKRLSKIGEGSVKRPSSALQTVPEADPILERAARASRWVREHQSVFGGLVAIAVLGAAGAGGWFLWQDRRNADASVLLAQAFADDLGHIAPAKDDDADDESATKQLYPSFKSVAERRDAALAKYRTVESKYAGTGAATLARLAEGSLLLDAGDAKGAIAAYDDVKSSPLARADAEVRGRALEGIGFAFELQAQSDAPSKNAHLDSALATFKALEAIDADGFKELGMYHEARVVLAQGDRTKAADLLKQVEALVSAPGGGHPFSYLQFVVEDRLREVDPTALPPKVPKTMGGRAGAGPGGAVDMSDPKVQELIRQLQRKARGDGNPPVAPAQGSGP